jgi:two-component system phosphate regulon sensor histidine kinase PhoR
MVEGVVALGADQRILFANERAAQLLEFQAQASTGRRFWEVVRRRSLQEVVRRALAEPEPYREELNWDGATAKSLTVHAARLPGSPPRGAVLVLHDTSELRRLERLRQDFVANVSHELKTPLSVITACVETLLDGAVDDPEARGPFLEQIAEQADRLHALILDMLSLARIESGTEALDFEAVPLEPLVQACLDRHRARAEGKGLGLQIADCRLQIGQSAPNLQSAICNLQSGVAVWADAEALSEILDNLVDNALKYTSPGGRIGVRWRAEDDHGVDKARSRELGGTGLGLSIVKHLVQSMHGTVSAASRLGQGTTFSVRLPRAVAV